MTDETSYCPFCNPESGREVIIDWDTVYSMYDRFPVSKGHVLVIPKRHCADYFELKSEEQTSCWEMVNEIKTMLTEKYNPDGFNIGININEAAGQTIPHVHVHLIPRYKGDVAEPEGGVRGVIPNKRKYKSNINDHDILPEITNKLLSFLQSKTQILNLIARADDYDETKRLISNFTEIKKARVPFYLKMDELDEILHWKLRGQYKRQYRNIKQNNDFLIKEVTQSAFAIENSDNQYEITLILKTLVQLHGVQIPVASAIMSLCYPDKYCVIDFRGWRQIFGTVKKYPNYTVKDYIKYWSIIKQMADNYGVTPQEVDMAIWQYDMENYRK